MKTKRMLRISGVLILCLCLLTGCGSDAQESRSSAAVSGETFRDAISEGTNSGTNAAETDVSEESKTRAVSKDGASGTKSRSGNSGSAGDVSDGIASDNAAEKEANSIDGEPAAGGEETFEEENTDPGYTEDMLVILQDPGMYTYEQFQSDAIIAAYLYRDLLTVDSLGTTADGRELYHFVAGNPNAEKQIFINAAIHGREYITAQLVMKQMIVYLQHVRAGDSYGGVSYQDMWNSVAVHVVPMVNPDGVTISQLGLAGVQTAEVLDGLYYIASCDGADPSGYYLDRWKANALGVDLNRNFDAYWENYADPVGHVSSDHYKGTSIGSEIESAALINLTNQCHFSYTISYHAQGQVIYWCFENMDPIYDIQYAWVSKLAASTGYMLDGNYSAIDPAGYSDWGLYRLQIPSITLEVGSGECPYLADQFSQIWWENLEVWEITILEAMGR